ncbi:MAG: hypothetical protein J6R13_00015 [Alistipes sp.]|nr:hypothetical protein [Alistipes sp.]
MIKRIIGTLATLGIVAVLVFVIMGRAEYSSALTFEAKPLSVSVEAEPVAEPLQTDAPDSIATENPQIEPQAAPQQ